MQNFCVMEGTLCTVKTLWVSWSCSMYVYIRSYKTDFTYNLLSGLTLSGEHIAILQWTTQKNSFM